MLEYARQLLTVYASPHFRSELETRINTGARNGLLIPVIHFRLLTQLRILGLVHQKREKYTQAKWDEYTFALSKINAEVRLKSFATSVIGVDEMEILTGEMVNQENLCFELSNCHEALFRKPTSTGPESDVSVA